MKKVFEKNRRSYQKKWQKITKIKDEYIKSQIKKRKELEGNSGSEVVERFFKYKIKELKKIKGDLIQKNK